MHSSLNSKNNSLKRKLKDFKKFVLNHEIHKFQLTLKVETFGKIREIFGRNFREFHELANFGFFARIIFREFML